MKICMKRRWRLNMTHHSFSLVVLGLVVVSFVRNTAKLASMTMSATAFDNVAVQAPPTSTHTIDTASIAKKWGLSSLAIPLLKQQVHRIVDYNSSTDLLAFFHPMKTGGTSLSDVLQQTFPDGVVPGSRKSGFFQQKAVQNAIQKAASATDFWSQQRVLYSHTNVRHGLLEKFFYKNLTESIQKRIRHMVMIRDPVTLRASAYYEWMCHIGTWVRRKEKELGEECPPVNLTDVAIVRGTKICNNKKKSRQCQKLKRGEIDFDYCGSVDALLNSSFYRKTQHNQYQKFVSSGNTTELALAWNKQDYESVELHTLQDLGGFVNVDSTRKADHVWFGITERMQESMCLFHYMLRLEPLEMPRLRHKSCRPTDFWEERHVEKVKSLEKMDYAVWRAANAIMDVRVQAMQLEIQARVDGGESLESIPYIAPGCFPMN